jgi:hypothetical protein
MSRLVQAWASEFARSYGQILYGSWRIERHVDSSSELPICGREVETCIQTANETIVQRHARGLRALGPIFIVKIETSIKCCVNSSAVLKSVLRSNLLSFVSSK